MNMKYYIEPEAVKSLREISEGVSALSKGITSSPLMECMRQMDEQNKLFKQQFSGLSYALSLTVSPHIRALQEAARGLNPFFEQISEMRSAHQELMDKFQEQRDIFRESYKHIDALRSTFDFPQFSKAFQSITDVIPVIPRQHILKLRLHSEHWLISDDLLSRAVENDLYENTVVVGFVIDFYKMDGWQQLERLVENWQQDILPERLEIFRSVIEAVKIADNQNIHNLTVPTLIPQIDGLVRDLYAILPQDIKKRVEQEVRDSLPKELQSKRTDVRNEVAVQTIAEVVDFWSAEMLQETIFSALFRNSNHITSDDSYSLFRHKIMHGDREFLEYGNEENFIRSMLYAEFIIGLIRQIKAHGLQIDQAA